MPRLFSYGTLLRPAVQMWTFGSLLEGHADEPIGFEQLVVTVSDAELARADQYQPAGYERIPTTLASGREAWVYAETSPR